MQTQTVKLALLQYKLSPQIQRNEEKALNLTEQAAKGGAQIIILPELFNNTYFCQYIDEQYFDWALERDADIFEHFATLARQYKAVVVVPYFEKRAAGIYHNSLKVIGVDGREAAHYRKMHIPDDPKFYEKYYFTPGDEGFKTTQTPYLSLGTLICWDQWFPEAARSCALAGAELIIYPTAIATLAGEDANDKQRFLHAWKTIQQSHAIANGCFVAAVNRVGEEDDLFFWGHSFVSGPFGEIIVEAGDEEQLLSTEIDLAAIENQRREWPFMRDRRIEHYKDLQTRFNEQSHAINKE